MVVYVDLATNPHGVIIIVVLWVMTALSALFLGLRIYSKLSRGRRLWWDDYLISISWVFLLLSGSSSTANSRLGFGLHFDEVPPENLIRFGIQSNVSGFASVIAVAISKTSFGLTLFRLTDGWMRWLVVALLVLLNVTHCFGALSFWVSCNPPAKTWNPMLPGECWPSYITISTSLFVGACSAFCDFVLALLPWRLFLRFDMYNKEKIGMAIAMSLGVFAGITCIIKMTKIPLLYHGDFSNNAVPLVIWGFLEPSLTIIAASVPVMRHLFKFRRDARDIPTTASSSSSPSSNVTHASPARDSVGGSRERRFAAARAHGHNTMTDTNGNSNDDASQTEKGG